MNSYVVIALNSVAVYLFIVIAIRITGKKELSQLSVIDLVLIMLISNAVQNAMVGQDSTLTGGLVAATALFCANYFLKRIFYRHKKLETFIEGSPVMLIHEGKLIPEHLEKEKISVDELELAAREHGVEKLSDVNLAVLETDGSISILSKDYHHRTNRKRKHSKQLPTASSA